MMQENVFDYYGELQNFTNGLFGNVRSILINREPWFVGRDVAACLGYVKVADAVRNHVNDEDKGVFKIETPGGNQDIIFINESGLYSLIFSSKLPIAQEFKHWVTHEVLPTMRKIGFYNSMQILQDTVNKLQQNNVKLYKENKQLQEENDKLRIFNDEIREDNISLQIELDDIYNEYIIL